MKNKDANYSIDLCKDGKMLHQITNENVTESTLAVEYLNQLFENRTADFFCKIL